MIVSSKKHWIDKIGIRGKRRKNTHICVKFSEKHIGKDPDWWKNIIEADESKVAHFKGHDGYYYIWQKQSFEYCKNLVSIVKHEGDNVMVWEYFAASRLC